MPHTGRRVDEESVEHVVNTILNEKPAQLRAHGRDLDVLNILYTGPAHPENDREEILEYAGRIYPHLSYFQEHGYDFAQFRCTSPDINREIEQRVEQRYVNTQELTWDEFEDLAEQLALRITDHVGDVDGFIHIETGGTPVGEYLEKHFNLPSDPVRASHYNGRERSSNVTVDENSLHLPRLEEASRVVLVDEIVDTGGTMESLHPRLAPRFDNLYPAALHVKPWTTFWPDFYVEETVDWVIYPWEQDR